MTGLYQLIPHHLRAEYEAKGWTVTDDLSDCHHGQHSVLMRAPEGFIAENSYCYGSLD